MTLNKNSAHVLLCLLGGRKTVAQVSQIMQNVDIRSLQRALVRLADLGLVDKKGVNNNPVYDINYNKLLNIDIPSKLLEQYLRPDTKTNQAFIDWLNKLPKQELDSVLSNSIVVAKAPEMSAKELEYLTIELSWKSSALEGNTYTLLDTQLLIVDGIKARHKTDFETQMILNHKNALSFIIENKEQFMDNIQFATLEELHRIISFNLGINSGVRKRIVKITGSNYQPLNNPHQLKEVAANALNVINRSNNPFSKALVALALIPYLQIFEDGNKRTGRMLANAILISWVNRGFSLRKVDAKELALAYLSFYEFNSIKALSKILEKELKV